jgi:hypothetical protein
VAKKPVKTKTVTIPADLFADDSAPDPIGVPAGYVAEKPRSNFDFSYLYGAGPTIKSNPRYVAGHQYNPATLPVDDIIDLQQKLVAAGLMDDGDYTVGVWDNVSTKAYEQLLGEANMSGDDEETALTRRIQTTQLHPKEKEKKTRPPLIVRLSNPDDLRAVAKRAASDLYGGNLPDEDVERFVASYRSMEDQYQRQQDAMQYTGVEPGPGGTVTQPADPEVMLENQVRREHPNEVAATAFGARMNDIISTFTGTRAGG